MLQIISHFCSINTKKTLLFHLFSYISSFSHKHDEISMHQQIIYLLIILHCMDIECETLIQQNKQQLLYNSGHFFAEMGLWQDCVDSPSNNSYFMANFINNRTKANATMYLGMCLPSVCDKDFVKELMNQGMAEYQQQIIQMVGAPLAVGSIDVNPQSYTFSYSGWFYFTVITFALLLFMSVFALFWGSRKKKQKYTALDKVIQSFSLAESMKIFVYKSNYLNIFNGIKALCMFWVIFGHQFSVRLKYDVNISGIPGQVEKFFYLFVTGAFLAVDVFFFIGGFLVAYSFLRQKSKSVLKYPMAVLHRVLRFWPSYLMAIMLYYSVYIHSNSGPLWKENLTLGQIPYCQGAWKTLLFIDNLVDNGEKMCMAWGWYLQNDMQIFVFSLFFIFLYMKNRLAGYASLIAMICVGLFFNFYGVDERDILHVTHLRDFIKWNEYFINVYIKPWIRCPPYILGLIFGLLHMEYLDAKKKLKEDPDNQVLANNFYIKMQKRMLKKRYISWVSQLLGVALMLTTILVPHDLQKGNVWPEWAHAFYLSFEKVTFTFGVYLMILPTLLEVPNMAFFLLDTRFFNFVSKISFWVYLFHFMAVQYVSYGEKVDFYYTPETIVPLYCSIAVISMIFAFFGTILVEVPFSKLEKMLFSVLLKSGSKPKKIENSESIITNGKQSLVQSIDPESSGGELKEALLRVQDKQKFNINRSVNE